ncbi:hypothetical protein SEPCBS57363_005924 [Sporothrix epigloea]|uniref:C2H2-type domain-containing protein n=1 Tax=Sporothrix epigloea TaxID=1892477 RepID=A0ABP0E243_9PEZI
MHISALCIPEEGSENQQLFSQYDSIASPGMTNALQFKYVNAATEFGGPESPRSSSIGASSEDLFSDQVFSGSATPISEPVPVPHSSASHKRSAGHNEDNNWDEECPGKKRRAAYEFACPFYKRNRMKYCHQRSCRTSGWPSVHRVKEHLYRHHMHYVCERCSQTFKAPEPLREHQRQTRACDVSKSGVPEDAGFDLQTEKKLRSRKKIDGQTEADKWSHMYQLLFSSGSAQYMPSPFVDYSSQDETYSMAEESEEASLYPSYLRPESIDCKSNSFAAITPVAMSTEHQNSANESRSITSDNMLLGSTDHSTSRNRMMLAGVSDEELYGCQIVSKTDIYEMVRDQVRAVLSTTGKQPLPTHTMHRMM